MGTMHDIITLKDPNSAVMFENVLAQQCDLGAVPVSCAGPGESNEVPLCYWTTTTTTTTITAATTANTTTTTTTTTAITITHDHHHHRF
jgi:hypothetical protein